MFQICMYMLIFVDICKISHVHVCKNLEKTTRHPIPSPNQGFLGGSQGGNILDFSPGCVFWLEVIFFGPPFQNQRQTGSRYLWKCSYREIYIYHIPGTYIYIYIHKQGSFRFQVCVYIYYSYIYIYIYSHSDIYIRCAEWIAPFIPPCCG